MHVLGTTPGGHGPGTTRRRVGLALSVDHVPWADCALVDTPTRTKGVSSDE